MSKITPPPAMTDECVTECAIAAHEAHKEYHATAWAKTFADNLLEANNKQWLDLLAQKQDRERNFEEFGEGWESLAWELCAQEHGEEACSELIWEGGPIPEPWGDRWLKYEDEAKRLIALVHKHAAPVAQQAVPAGCKVVPVEPTPEMLAGAAMAVLNTASGQDLDLARKAARIVLEKVNVPHGMSLDVIASSIATMAPAYRAMLDAAPEAPAQADRQRVPQWHEAVQKVAAENDLEPEFIELVFNELMPVFMADKDAAGYVTIPLDSLIECDSYDVHGSDFYRCKVCGAESGAGVLNKGISHASDCPLAAAPVAQQASAPPPAPTDTIRVACITLDGSTLTVPVKNLADVVPDLISETGDVYTLTIKEMTVAEYEALGEFNGF